MSRIKRQAVVLIHGIGEQKPMDTLRGFVDSMTKGTDSKIYNQPDNTNDMYELRRLSVYTRGVRTEYFEYYWAYHMRGTKLGHVLSWIRQVLFRPASISPRIKWLFYWIWIVVLTVLGTVLAMWLHLLDATYFPMLSTPTILIAVNIINAFITYILIYYLGDAARYTYPSPENIEDRKRIRAGGLQLLRTLHSKKNLDGTNRYDRIILVGHSLGTIIGYDLLKYLWIDFYKLTQSPIKDHPPVLWEFEKNRTTENFEDTQSSLFKEQQSLGNPWLISDFISLGSPLTHAHLLMAWGKNDFQEKVRQREHPTCPPEFENDSISYKTEYGTYSLHHAALFSCTRWNNIYFRNDYVGGPLQSYFGRGITDHKIKTNHFLPDVIPFLSHTCYWEDHHSAKNRCSQAIERIKAIVYKKD